MHQLSPPYVRPWHELFASLLRGCLSSRPAAMHVLTGAFFLNWGLFLSAEAGGLITQLPPDGSWSRFDLEIASVNDKGESRVVTTGSYEIRSVGRVTREGTKYRRLELDFRLFLDPEPDFVEIHSVLIPEDRLTKDDDPSQHIEQVWQKTTDERSTGAVQVRDAEVAHLKRMLLPWVFHGRLEDAKPLGPESVETKLGEIECAGLTGSRVLKSNGVQDHFHYEARLSPEAPFGVVKLQTDFRRKFSNGEWAKGIRRRVLTLSKSGNNAEPAIPEAR